MHTWLSLRSRRLEVVGERENGRARGRHAKDEGAPSPLACLLLAHPFFSCAHYFQAPATQATLGCNIKRTEDNVVSQGDDLPTADTREVCSVSTLDRGNFYIAINLA